MLSPVSAAPLPGWQEERRVAGWTVHVSTAFPDGEAPAVEQSIAAIGERLEEIARLVPPSALTALRRIPLWLSPEYPRVRPTAEYHPDAGWLRLHGRDPAMAKGVEFTNLRILAQEFRRMPMVVLHELAHGYHDQVLGFTQVEILAAYQHAQASGIYDRVERFHGPGRADTFERAYAMTNHKEYFAECTEAFFGRNDFFPFDRAQLAAADPEMERLLQRLWALPVAP